MECGSTMKTCKLSAVFNRTRWNNVLYIHIKTHANTIWLLDRVQVAVRYLPNHRSTRLHRVLSPAVRCRAKETPFEYVGKNYKCGIWIDNHIIMLWHTYNSSTILMAWWYTLWESNTASWEILDWREKMLEYIIYIYICKHRDTNIYIYICIYTYMYIYLVS